MHEDFNAVSNSDGFDTCGYDDSGIMSIDTRNTKFQARINHVPMAASNKSFNHKDMVKYQKKKGEKEDRDHQREQDEILMRQMQADNIKWKAVDSCDAKHLQRDALKRQKENEKASKKKEKEDLIRAEEDNASSAKKSVKKGMKWQ